MDGSFEWTGNLVRGDVWHLRYTMSVQMILKPQKSVDLSTFLSAPYENC